MDAFHVRRVARSIHAGGVVAYPTEAVYGLGCDPRNALAVQRLLAIKQRPAHKGLILIAAEFAQLAPFLQPLTAADHALLNATWPGPYTWLIPALPSTPTWLRGRHDTLAVRITAHPLAAALCQACGHALVSTSANISNRQPARTALAVRRQLGNQLDALLTGATGGAQHTTVIRDLRSQRQLR